MAKMIIIIEPMGENKLIYSAIKDALKGQIEKLNKQYATFVKISLEVIE